MDLYLATAIATNVEVGPTLPNGTQATEQQFNSITVPLVSNAGSRSATGGGFQCTIGPVNDRSLIMAGLSTLLHILTLVTAIRDYTEVDANVFTTETIVDGFIMKMHKIESI